MPLFFLEHRPVARLWMSCAALVMAGCNDTPAPVGQQDAARPALVVKVASSASRTGGYIAEVRAVSRAELAFAVSGRVSSLQANVGDPVRAGQLLATLDNTTLRAQQSAADGEQQAASAKLQEVRQRLARTEAARQAQAISAGELDALHAELQTATTALITAKAQQQQANWALQQASLRAPVDGVIGSRALALGQAVSPGSPAFTIEGAGRELALWLPAGIELSVGQSLSLLHEGQRHAGKVLRIAATLGAGGQRQVFVSAPSDAQPGDTWQVQIPSQSSSGAVIPLRALLPSTDARHGYVLRLAGDGKTVEKIAVQLGVPHDDSVSVASGLKAGDRIIVAGGAAIAPGSRITPVQPHEGEQP
ncbi:efflux RND transporter periplasmic adaptor subunit [Chromobacterium violaceum]|uniref:efflux RND transporter periplasmic adaptor subunit n=1 Tax=Chromobacterium violaceum TaxID=536 RepID=UPI001E355FCA|nr:efflux RND transporter periplasmic adaptor subunit [Chromobacterium violaceum]MCD0494057.1 efflux RND transporter periplasmic adaptor subunit [Chromobacterium violaceum]